MLSSFLGSLAQRFSLSGVIAMMLLTATALGSAVVAFWRAPGEKSFRNLLDFVLPHEIITHRSARADALFWVTRRSIMPFLLMPTGLTFVAGVGYLTHAVVGRALGIHEPLLGGPAGPATICVFTLTMLIAYDISYYLYHVAQHRIPFLWELHKVHHSAEVLVGITKDRVHPLDELMNRIWDGLIPGVCFGLWSLIALDPVEITVFGIDVYIMRNILMMDFVRHTHLKISFGRANHVILCPHWHQLHHSIDPIHYDKNFGLLFSFWDRLFGTQFIPGPNEDFTFGLIDRDVRDYQSLFGLYVLPLKKMWRHVVGRPVVGRPVAQPTIGIDGSPN